MAEQPDSPDMWPKMIAGWEGRKDSEATTYTLGEATSDHPKNDDSAETRFIRKQYDSWTGINTQQFVQRLTENTSLQTRLIVALEALGFHGTIDGKIQRSALREPEISLIKQILKL